MGELYFRDDEHKQNYERVKARWPLCISSSEYQSACYLVSVPLLFEKVGSDIEKWDTPVEWMYSHIEGELDIDLTTSMQCMAYLMLQLWNGSHKSDILEAISYLDKGNYMIFKCAMDVRRGFHLGQ